MPTIPTTRDAIRAALRTDGPMTAAELARALGRKVKTIDSALSCARRYGTKYIRITGYERRLGTSGRMAPVYDLGPGRDAPPLPPLTRAECARRYNEGAGRARRTRLRNRARPELAWMAGLGG